MSEYNKVAGMKKWNYSSWLGDNNVGHADFSYI